MSLLCNQETVGKIITFVNAEGTLTSTKQVPLPVSAVTLILVIALDVETLTLQSMFHRYADGKMGLIRDGKGCSEQIVRRSGIAHASGSGDSRDRRCSSASCLLLNFS
jgi:hypothetical protein